jgi:murein DD-endopeptidase MepM/ murein hydrolase activator NlpD
MHHLRAYPRIIAALLALCLMMPVAPAFAVTNSDVAAHQAAADAARRAAAAEQAKADDLARQTASIDQQIGAIEGEVGALEGQIGTASARRTKLESELDLLRGDITDKEAAIGRVKEEYQRQNDLLNARADATYRAGDWFYLQVLLESTDFQDLITRTSLVARIFDADRGVADELAGTRTSLEKTTAELNRSLDEVAAKRAEAQAEESKLQGLHADRASKLSAQEAARAQKAALLSDTKDNVARLTAIAKAEEAESARIAALLKGGGSSKGSGRYPGSMAWPTPGYSRITSPFGWRMHPVLHVKKFHSGVDIGAPSGATIVAAGDGTVISAGYNGGYGNMTMIDHGNGLVSVYGHQSRISVSKGQRVTKGQTIGAVGSTGMSTGPHLHFEIRVNGEPRDPLGGYI